MGRDGKTVIASPHDIGFDMPINLDKLRVRSIRAAEGYLELSMPDHALRELDHCKEWDCETFDVYMVRGDAYLMKLDHHQALEVFRKGHLSRPTNLIPLMKMAWCFKRIDQLQQAIDSMKLAYQFHKNVPTVLYNLACYYALAGEKENALSWLGRSLRMDRGLLKSIPDESDFDSLRSDSDFQHLLELSENV